MDLHQIYSESSNERQSATIENTTANGLTAGVRTYLLAKLVLLPRLRLNPAGWERV